MAVTHGMDPAVVTENGNQLKNLANEIREKITRAESLVRGLNDDWKGEDYGKWSSDFDPIKTAGNNACQQLDDLGQKAITNAEAQRATSEQV